MIVDRQKNGSGVSWGVDTKYRLDTHYQKERSNELFSLIFNFNLFFKEGLKNSDRNYLEQKFLMPPSKNLNQ